MNDKAPGDPSGAAGPGGRAVGAERLRELPTRLLSLAAVHSDRRVNEELARVDARKWHYAVLATLEEFGPASQAELSARTGIYRSDMVGVLNELAGRGLVERAPDPADRRRNVVTPTRSGRRHLLRLDSLLAAVEDEVLAPLTSAQRAQLTRLLAKLVDHHGRQGDRSM
ncbi:DNA-binding transcriptional regulator, MarR family [Actinopolymorpha cephalotaxi]|uniref:DNA-binding MarR family transcriptional regulator n=1 Tax=Actinopolymorpha cephalotaxi TaxID=504797 RepID=A0A1I2ZK78_9ACTN|nr:MarR family transcriptional regulator [Actinopolymorpha cephalotaxi]NYH82046.1 DNA-binding MarR family transcriptional regulator [Actinopolymorpha cephalotaxi]SFH38257.1 DNA-binding transcriptional regulator, MarR family [Actinopolymorpha cephalotaxi]